MTGVIGTLVSAFSRLDAKRVVVSDAYREAYDPIRQKMELHGNLVEQFDEEVDPARRMELEAQMHRLRKLARYRSVPRSRW